MLVGKDSCHPTELRRDLSHNGNLEHGGEVWEDKWHVLGDTREGRPHSLTPPDSLSSEPCHEINLHNKKMSLSARCFMSTGRVGFSREEKQVTQGGVRAPECSPATAQGHSKLCNGKGATALKELLLIHSFN